MFWKKTPKEKKHAGEPTEEGSAIVIKDHNEEHPSSFIEAESPEEGSAIVIKDRKEERLPSFIKDYVEPKSGWISNESLSKVIRSTNPVYFKVNTFDPADVMPSFNPMEIEYLGFSRKDGYPCFAFHGNDDSVFDELLKNYRIEELYSTALAKRNPHIMSVSNKRY